MKAAWLGPAMCEDCASLRKKNEHGQNCMATAAPGHRAARTRETIKTTPSGRTHARTCRCRSLRSVAAARPRSVWRSEEDCSLEMVASALLRPACARAGRLGPWVGPQESADGEGPMVKVGGANQRRFAPNKL